MFFTFTTPLPQTKKGHTVTVSTEPRKLRSYQCEAVDAVIGAWGRDKLRRVGVVLPTGAGKSTVIAALAVQSHRLGLRVVMLAHRGELLDQMIDSVVAVDPTLHDQVGIVRAEQNDTHHPIIAATLQTLGSERRLEQIGSRDVILWDEVHHIGAETYHKLLVDLGGYENAYMCGFTATMMRDDKVKLSDSIEKVVYEKDLLWAIDNGFLTKPRGLAVKIDDLDLSKVKTRAGDYAQGELETVMEASADSIVHAILTNIPERRSIIFAAGVENARHLAASLTDAGLAAESVTGADSREIRAGVYARYRSGETRALVTVQVLTEGADFPMCDCVVMARPTQSRVLYSQMVGRALRLYEGKTDALVLDLVGSTREMSLINITDLGSGMETVNITIDGEIIEPEIDPEPVEEKPAKPVRQGPIDLVSIDLLTSAETPVLWLETHGGTPFFEPTGSGMIVFVWQVEANVWRAAHMPSKGSKATGGWIGTPTTLAAATAEAVRWATEVGYSLPQRKASWRRNQPPSDAQARFGNSLGIHGVEFMTRARLSDEISRALVTERLGR